MKRSPATRRNPQFYLQLTLGLSLLTLSASATGLVWIAVLAWIHRVGVARGPQMELGESVALPVVVVYFVWGLFLTICIIAPARGPDPPSTMICMALRVLPFVIAGAGVYAVRCAVHCPQLVAPLFRPWLDTPVAYLPVAIETLIGLAFSVWAVRGLRPVR